jgi:arylsulfatase
MPDREYKPGTTFPGVIGRTPSESTPAWPEPVRAREGAPNVLFIVLDDTGFGQLGCYGSPIRTPNIDRLAKGGLLYNNMHTTALCSPTRACILTGRNHHSNAMAGITEISTGFPGYNGVIPFENGFLSEILHQQGYNTFAIGKWHLTPTEQTSAAGPYDRWPLGRGFERFYGFLGGDTHQYYPDLVYDNHQVDPPRTPEEGYHLTVDLVDHAIAFIEDSKQVAPEKPFFMYFCTGAMHAPHHVPKEWADRYEGAFDDGWDAYRERTFKRQKELGVVPKDAVLSRHDPDVQDWKKLSDGERRLYARMMEVFAGFLEHTDEQIGRLLSALEKLGQLDNTLVMLISDNGASAEGGPSGSVNENKFFNFVPDSLEQNLQALDDLGGPKFFNHYPWGWAHAGDTPFKRWKRETYRGGTTDPFLVHWPAGIRAKGQIRTQYAHAIDMVPTVLDALGIEPPAAIRGVTQSPIEGVSFAHTFDDRAAGSLHVTQYFEMFGHRALYHDGWRAVCPFPGPSFSEAHAEFGKVEITEELLRDLDAKHWELYHVARDPSETKNLAQEERGRLIEMIAMWYTEAGKYDVLPIDSRGQQRLALERPQIARERTRYTYYPSTQGVPQNVQPQVINRPHSIIAELTLEDGDGEGVILACGGVDGGYALYMEDGCVKYLHNYVAADYLRVDSKKKLGAGEHTVRYEFEATGEPDIQNGKGSPGVGRLFVDDEQVGESEFAFTTPLGFGIGGGLVVGRMAGSPIWPEAEPPFAFNGTIREVTVETSGDGEKHVDHEMRVAMARQ